MGEQAGERVLGSQSVGKVKYNNECESFNTMTSNLCGSDFLILEHLKDVYFSICISSFRVNVPD